MKKNKILIVPIIACAIFVVAGGLMVLQGMKNMEEAGAGYEAEASYDMATAYDTDSSMTDTITWNGKKYRYNDHLSNYLFLGVDKEELADTQMGYLDAGQTDAIFLLSWDRVEGDMTVVSIPRDTMTPYNYYGREGVDLGRVKEHINLIYAYGDGKHESCKLSIQAVSDLFYGIPIEQYSAISLDALSEVMKEVGTVTVTIPNNSLEYKYPEYKEGTQIALDSENIEPFIRYRNIEVSQSALTRLERQEVFLEAFMGKAEEKFAEDPGFVTRSYEALQPYMVTNMGADQFARLMECLISKGKPAHWTLPGTGTEGAVYDEYHVDEDALYEKVIETFYIEEV